MSRELTELYRQLEAFKASDAHWEVKQPRIIEVEQAIRELTAPQRALSSFTESSADLDIQEMVEPELD